MQVEEVKRQKLKNVDVFISPLRLCVRNIPATVQDQQLRTMFQQAAGDKKAVVTEVGLHVVAYIIMEDYRH